MKMQLNDLHFLKDNFIEKDMLSTFFFQFRNDEVFVRTPDVLVFLKRYNILGISLILFIFSFLIFRNTVLRIQHDLFFFNKIDNCRRKTFYCN